MFHAIYIFSLITCFPLQSGELVEKNLNQEKNNPVSESSKKVVADNEKKSASAQYQEAQVELATLKKELLESEKEIAKFEKLVGPKDPVLKQLRAKVEFMRKSIQQLEKMKETATPSGKTNKKESKDQPTTTSVQASDNQKKENQSTESSKEVSVKKVDKSKKSSAPSVPLSVQIAELKREWLKAKDEEAKKAIKARLLDVLEQQFDRDLQVREQKLVAAENRLAKLREQLEKMVEAKKKIINTYADATTTSWDHPTLLKGALGAGSNPPAPQDPNTSKKGNEGVNQNFLRTKFPGLKNNGNGNQKVKQPFRRRPIRFRGSDSNPKTDENTLPKPTDSSEDTEQQDG